MGISVLLAFAMLGSTPQEGNAGNNKGFLGILNHPWPCVYIQRQGTVEAANALLIIFYEPTGVKIR